MRDKILQACRTLLPEGGVLYCAVSGGADSVALLHLLRTLQDELPITLRAAHFNHQLRGDASDSDEAFVRDLCSRLDIPLTVQCGDTLSQIAASDDSCEEAARRLRYAFFDSLPGAVATAHTADDNFETLLINLLRGTGLAGLGGIPPRRGKIIRPMLQLSRADVESYLQAHRLLHVEDSSNASDDYLRNRLRHAVIPHLKAENPALLSAVFALTTRLRADESLLHSLAAQALERAKTPDGILCSELRTLPEPLLHRAALMLLDGISDRTAQHVQALTALIATDAPSAQIHLPGGRIARREYDYLRFDLPVFLPLPTTKLQIPGTTRVGRFEITCSITDTPVGLSIPYTQGRNLYVRCRQTGDTLRLPGGTKTIKKLMIDHKIPALKRDSIPVLCDASGPIALLGVAAATSDLRESRTYLTISYKELYD